MQHYSPGFTEIGVFDIDEANHIAQEIDSGIFESARQQASGRAIVHATRDIDRIFQRISLVTMADVSGTHQTLRTRVCSQDFAKIDKLTFSGLPWHIDASGSPMSAEQFDFNFGASSHPTKAFVGLVDLTDSYNYLDKECKYNFDVFPEVPSLVIGWAQKMSIDAMEKSVEEGNGRFVTAEPGVLYRFGNGTVHQMQPFDQGVVHPLRFSIDQYLIG
jgi:hypothetical protein